MRNSYLEPYTLESQYLQINISQNCFMQNSSKLLKNDKQQCRNQKNERNNIS